MKWLVLGSSGMLGTTFCELLERNEIPYTAPSSSEIDIRDTSITNIRLEQGVTHCLNAAAYTQVDQAESESQKAFEINCQGAKNVSILTARNQVKLFYVSTDYVFPGEKKEAYERFDSPDPINEYGKSKLCGEDQTLQNNPNSYVVRTSSLYGKHGVSFPKSVLRKIFLGEKLYVVSDQASTPTSTRFLSDFIFELAQSNREERIYHGVPRGKASWYDFASLLNEKFGNQEVIAIRSSQISQRAKRPAMSQLQPEAWVTKKWQDDWSDVSSEIADSVRSAL
jgi:dTDP-4-dehydrorhamnose reductase